SLPQGLASVSLGRLSESSQDSARRSRAGLRRRPSRAANPLAVTILGEQEGSGVMHPIAQYTAVPIGVLPRQATSDDQLVDLWLHGRPAHTQRAYRADSDRFRTFVARPFTTV